VTLVRTATICVVGAGYVGLPLSDAFAKHFKVVSYDIDLEKIVQLSGSGNNPNHTYTTDAAQISEADFICICVPTPLSEGKRPDMSFIKSATAVVGHWMKTGAVVVVESSVYPGATEELLKPILERESGFTCGRDFKLAYSPERINPGDDAHNVDKVTKIVAGCDEETLECVAALYQTVTPQVFKAKDIRTAEAAKLVENIQRDLNIALVNELSMIFEKMGMSTCDVLEAAATKWNFQKLSPGLVGGYCIPVVPYFLVQKAREYGCSPQIILAGRAINEYIPRHIAEMTFKSLNNAGKVIKDSKVLIMGCTYKENVEDARETPVREVIKELHEYGLQIWGYDPFVKNGARDFGIKFVEDLTECPKIDCLILTVAHESFRRISAAELISTMDPSPVIIDIPGLFDIPEIHCAGIAYKRM
jgi:UDP-N-acetyl-D-glucosamine/UDP-N-acetyl-D-galactosamine dehydrogenase